MKKVKILLLLALCIIPLCSCNNLYKYKNEVTYFEFMEQFKEEVKDSIIRKNMNFDFTYKMEAIEKYKAFRGAVIVMNPRNGEILAYAVYPYFDPNNFKTATYFQTKNWTLTDVFPPGSTFKIITALEYMRENSGYSGYSYDCSGFIEEAGTTIHCYNGKVHGEEDLRDSFAHSCNSSFCNTRRRCRYPRWSYS